MANVIDKSYDKSSGDLTQFTIIDDTGQPRLKKANMQNILLFDPEDELPFDGGLRSFFEDGEAIVFQEDPILAVSRTSDSIYEITFEGRVVETSPKQSKEFLQAFKRALVEEDISGIVSVYRDIISNQVRRDVINALKNTFPDPERLNITGSGWVIDGFYLVTWEAEMYVTSDNLDQPDVVRSGSSVVETDRSREFIEYRDNYSIDPVTITIGETDYTLTEREMLFISKVKWLLNRRHFHPDMPFWYFADKRADVDWKTGEPNTSDSTDTDRKIDEPDLDSFSL